LPMMLCSLLLGILCAVPRVGAVLRFDVDADAEIEDDDDDDDRPHVMPRRRQTKSGQPVSSRTDEPSIQGARFVRLACNRAPTSSRPSDPRPSSVATARDRCAASMNEPNDVGVFATTTPLIGALYLGAHPTNTGPGTGHLDYGEKTFGPHHTPSRCSHHVSSDVPNVLSHLNSYPLH
jgi:hypothetical protein